MKSIRTTRAFEHVARNVSKQYDITLQSAMERACRSFKKQSFNYSVNKKHKGSGKVRNLNGLKIDLKPREFQALFIRFWLDELFKTKKRKIVPFQSESDDEETFLNSCIFHSEEFEDDNDLIHNVRFKCEYAKVEIDLN